MKGVKASVEKYSMVIAINLIRCTLNGDFFVPVKPQKHQEQRHLAAK